MAHLTGKPGSTPVNCGHLNQQVNGTFRLSAKVRKPGRSDVVVEGDGQRLTCGFSPLTAEDVTAMYRAPVPLRPVPPSSTAYEWLRQVAVLLDSCGSSPPLIAAILGACR